MIGREAWLTLGLNSTETREGTLDAALECVLDTGKRNFGIELGSVIKKNK